MNTTDFVHLHPISYILKQNLGGLAGALGGATAGMHLTGVMVYFIQGDPEAGRPTRGPC
jgi:hypothetical protein